MRKPPGDIDLSTIGGRIRWVIEKRLRIRHADFARRLGVKAPQLSRWINRPDRPPSEEYIRRIADMAGVPAAWLRYGQGEPEEAPGAPPAAVEAEAPSPNYEGLGIDLPGYERLLERPRRMFDAFMLELIGRGLGREDLEDIGRSLLAPIAGFNTVYKDKDISDARREESQIKILSGLIAEAREIVKGDAA